jgi:hypothetical protein
MPAWGACPNPKGLKKCCCCCCCKLNTACWCRCALSRSTSSSIPPSRSSEGCRSPTQRREATKKRGFFLTVLKEFETPFWPFLAAMHVIMHVINSRSYCLGLLWVTWGHVKPHVGSREAAFWRQRTLLKTFENLKATRKQSNGKSRKKGF